MKIYKIALCFNLKTDQKVYLFKKIIVVLFWLKRWLKKAITKIKVLVKACDHLRVFENHIKVYKIV